MEQIILYLKQILPAIVLFGSMTIIEFVPIKINPWSAIGKLIQKAVGTDKIEKRFDEVDKQFAVVDNKLNAIDIKFNERIESMKRSSAESEVLRIRTYLINLWSDMKFGAQIDDDQSADAYAKIERYEHLCEKYDIENSQCNDAIEGIRNYYKHPELHKKQIVQYKSLGVANE